MDKSTLETLIRQGFSIGQISKLTNKSKTSIRHWLNKFNLKTKNKSFKEFWFSKETKQFFDTFNAKISCNHQCSNDFKNILINDIFNTSKDNFI